MSIRETTEVTVAGHKIALKVDADEKRHMERAAEKATQTIHNLGKNYGANASPQKIAAMAAFQFAFELSIADEMLKEADSLEAELKKQRETVKRLESLLAKMDEALAV
jgi:cell division protein ZapA (FtsZ GTPase activity inhibitor)